MATPCTRASVVLLLLAVSLAQINTAFVELSKPCEPGCETYGNCNIEDGRCECPYGLTGPTCKEYVLPACRRTDKPGVPLFTGLKAPRNCECYQQLKKLSCTNDMTCDTMTTQLWGLLKCFTKLDTPTEQQISDMPESSDATFQWFEGGTNDISPGVYDKILKPIAPPRLEDINHVVPLSHCPDRCNEHGFCSKYGQAESCNCNSGWSGKSCDNTLSKICPLECSGRGECVGGFCKCAPPYFGLGCTRSKAYAPQPGVKAPLASWNRLRVYMYELPMHLAGPTEFDDGWWDVFIIYQAYMRFQESFLNDWGVRTENPWEANLFYIPSFAYHATANLGNPTSRIVKVVDHVRLNYPWYNRTGGKDHFIILTADRGACYLAPDPLTEPLIKVVHFGMQKANISDMGPEQINKEYGCFKWERDIVAAPFFQPKMQAVQDAYAQVVKDGPLERDVLFFFAGDIRHNQPEYSGGVRQALANLLEKNKYPDVVFKGGFMPMSGPDYDGLLKKTKFCMAPYGHGWGIRLTHAMMHGCVPVIIQDKVHQPFEDLLPYEDFSVRISKAELPRVVEILRSIADADIQSMQRNMIKHYHAFIWQPDLGGLAYNYTIKSLERRLYSMRGMIYRRRRGLLESAWRGA